MRGKEAHELAQYATEGITPAYAGKSCGHQCRQYMPQDHPRVCGEKHGAPVSLMCSLGSPPRMRGKATFSGRHRLAVGITPAYAGKSERTDWTTTYRKDHPRVCGEKQNHVIVWSCCLGSPPRMRGKENSSGSPPGLLGITPAYAGKRLKRSHSIGHFSCILCLFHSVLHRASVSGGSRAGPCAPPCLPAQNAVPV